MFNALREHNIREGHHRKPLDPRLHRPEPPTSLRKRLAVSSFRRRRRLRRRRPSPISRSPLRPNQRLPEPSRHTHPNSATPGRLRPSTASTGGAATTENGREAAERDRKSAAASGGSPQAPAGTLHTQIWARPTHPRPCWSRVTDPARLRPTGTQSDACGTAGGGGGLGADWAAGAVGSRSHGPPAGRCARERASAGGRAGGGGPARRPASAGCAPGPSSSAWELPMSVGVCQGRAGGGVGDRGKASVADAAAGAALTGRAVCLGAPGIRRARKSGPLRVCALPGPSSDPNS